MTIGTLDVMIVGAKGLRDTEFLVGGIDPYVLIQYKGQERKSSVAKGQGSRPVWNENFTFRAEYPGGGGQHKMTFILMDKDTFSKDDYIGQANIYLKDLLALGVDSGVGELRSSKYRVIAPDQSYCGEIQVAVKFTPKVQAENNHKYDERKDSKY